MIIGLSGYAGSGKDAFAEFICKNDPSFQIKKFSGKLKEVAAIMLGVKPYAFENQDFKASELSDEWAKYTAHPDDEYVTKINITVRDFLQILGTDAIRDNLHPDAWVNALMADYRPAKLSEYRPTNWVITDVRFPNEYRAIKERGGIVVRIDRPGVGPVNDHPSETALDDFEFDFRIANVSDLTALEFSAKCLLDDIKA